MVLPCPYFDSCKFAADDEVRCSECVGSCAIRQMHSVITMPHAKVVE